MSPVVQKNMEDDKSPVLMEMGQSKNLLISFGGIMQGIGMPVFEFFNALSAIDCDKMFIRDFNQAWYQKGIDDKIKTIDQMRQYLADLIQEKGYEKVCFMGNSMGGYAAILFGLLLDIDKIIVFSPQTFINPFRRLISLDYRWKEQLKEVYQYDKRAESYYDLKRVLQRTPHKATVSIYYSTTHRLDNLHARRLKGIPGVQLFPINTKSHNIVKGLRDQGTLTQILKEIF